MPRVVPVRVRHPVDGHIGSVWVSGQFLNVTFTPENEPGEDIANKAADGSLCQILKTPDVVNCRCNDWTDYPRHRGTNRFVNVVPHQRTSNSGSGLQISSARCSTSNVGVFRIWHSDPSAALFAMSSPGSFSGVT